MRTLARAGGRERGFALGELVVAAGLLVLLAGAVSIVVSSASKNGNAIANDSLAETEARAAIDVLAQEIRQATGLDDTSWPIESLGTTQIQFLTPDRRQPYHLRRVAVRLNGTTLERAFATSSDTDGAPWNIPSLGAWQPIARHVSNGDVFSAVDAAGVATATATAAKTITIKLAISPPGNQGRTSILQSAATVRAG